MSIGYLCCWLVVGCASTHPPAQSPDVSVHGEVVGIVTNAAGEPIADATVGLVLDGEREHRAIGEPARDWAETTDDHGHFAFTDAHVGDHELTVFAGERTATRHVHVAAHATTTVTVELR